MQYHIQTRPIIDAFKTDCECPLCIIYNDISSRIVSQYLNEAVMEPEYRVNVNRQGFCSKHLKDLYFNENKLGLALQINTRTEHILKNMETVDNVKKAKKQAEYIDKTLSTCVICSEIDEMMIRYSYTIAQMYNNETFFPELLKSCKGFCLKHYSLLLKHSHHAGKSTQDYLLAISNIQQLQMTRLNKELETFTLKFDYRNSNTSNNWGTTKDSLPRAINKLNGSIISTIDK